MTTKQMADILGLSDRRIRQLENEGVLVKVAHGKFDLTQSVQTYIESLRERYSSAEYLNLKREQAMHEKAKRQKTELELQFLQADTHHSQDIELAMNAMVESFKSRSLLIPGTAAERVQHLKELEPIKEVIKEEVYEALQDLSEYNPSE
ncbi:phage terminase Nu1 subunit (DNA packaging protein) [Alkalibacillus filiformis]|uniref:Phage terminase Nu1 subunit (DNA packaging protein) n=1 Tax=Alkalibacillus filiformis TaxID=200990 RepID=A0ABU0DVK0_9BACI|nr:hypothetical protein [Alkalibacillus filiformis]MDQ0352484.1 phage terminase Nu1 subunit (DNA packaging protein) [Alkalibacillus filiformis]